MSFEDRLRTSLADNLDRLEVSPGDPAAAQRAGDRQRRQRTWTTGLAAAAVLAVVATGVVVARSGDDDGRLDPAPDTGSWTPLPDAPVSPRTRGLAFWTGSEAVFLGGETGNLCPPTASCMTPPTYARDGAAYDPATQTWRTLGPAPLQVAGHLLHTMVGGTLVVVGNHGSWHAYDVETDVWRDLPKAPVPLQAGELSALDGKVYVLGIGNVVQVLDLASAQWSTLPQRVQQPRINAQHVVATPEGIVVIGLDATVSNDGTVPSWLFAEVYENGEWRRLERSDMTGGYAWHWTGERLVSADLDCVDGGEVDGYGRCVPLGGILDPGTGTWAELPDPPEIGTGGWSLEVADGPTMTTYGYVYDDSTGAWAKLPQPHTAPDYDVAAVWADGSVIAFGGIHSGQGWDEDALSNKAWSWTP
jgi:hypothetical protein